MHFDLHFLWHFGPRPISMVASHMARTVRIYYISSPTTRVTKSRLTRSTTRDDTLRSSKPALRNVNVASSCVNPFHPFSSHSLSSPTSGSVCAVKLFLQADVCFCQAKLSWGQLFCSPPCSSMFTLTKETLCFGMLKKK